MSPFFQQTDRFSKDPETREDVIEEMLVDVVETIEEETGCLSESKGTHVRDSPSTSRMNDNDQLPCKCFISV
jgi:hypothetical protein